MPLLHNQVDMDFAGGKFVFHASLYLNIVQEVVFQGIANVKKLVQVDWRTLEDEIHIGTCGVDTPCKFGNAHTVLVKDGFNHLPYVKFLLRVHPVLRLCTGTKKAWILISCLCSRVSTPYISKQVTPRRSKTAFGNFPWDVMPPEDGLWKFRTQGLLQIQLFLCQYNLVSTFCSIFRIFGQR